MNQHNKKNIEYSGVALIKKFWTLAKSFKKKIITIMVLMLFVGSVDAIMPQMTKYAIDNYIVKGALDNLKMFSIVYISLGVIQSFLVWKFITLAGQIDIGVCKEVRRKEFAKLQTLEIGFFDKNPVGWLVSHLTSDVGKIGEQLAWGIVDLTWATVLFILIIVLMFIMNVQLALIAIVVMPILVATSIFFKRKMLDVHRITRKINAKITAAFSEGIMGFRATKLLTAENHHLKEFKTLSSDMYHNSVKAAILSSAYMPILLTFGTLSTALVLVAGGNKALLGQISFGTLAAFITYTILLYEPINAMSRVITNVMASRAAAERIATLLDTEPKISDSPTAASINLGDIKGKVEFKDVSFSYSGKAMVLENFNLTVNPGEMIALVGETGIGKTTIVNLAARFLEPTKGAILIDGIDYRERTQNWLHSQLGVVHQTPQLFSGTIKENIRYGRLDATDDEIIEAAKAANLHEFIIGLPNGYDSDIGEGGNSLSTGQKQLLSIARVLVADPRILILDEATSSVDVKTEILIQKAIVRAIKGRTSFVIAHRLSTIRAADRILTIGQPSPPSPLPHQERGVNIERIDENDSNTSI